MTESSEMSAAADAMRQTMPNYGPGDEVRNKRGDRFVVFSVRFCPNGNGQRCGWHTQTVQGLGGPSGIDLPASEFTRVEPETQPVLPAAASNAPFAAGDIVRIVLGSRLQQNAKFMLSDTLEIIECFQPPRDGASPCGWVVRVKRAMPYTPFAKSIDPLECFAAGEFEKYPAKTVTVRYVSDVRLTDSGELQVAYGEVAVPLP